MIRHLFLLFPFLAFGQVNMWTYDTANGGNNNGIIEQSEMQAALDAENNLIVDPPATITVTSTVNVDRNATQTIDWRGSTWNCSAGECMLVDKRGSGSTHTEMYDLTINGTNTFKLVKTYSRIRFFNVDVNGVGGASRDGGMGYQVLVYNEASSYGEWIMDGCDIDDINNSGSNNNTVAGTGGTGAGLQLQTEAMPSTPTRVIFRNATISNTVGEDTDGIFTHDRNSVGGSNSNLTYLIENVTVSNWERRAIKGFNGGVTYRNVTINNPDASVATGSMEHIFMAFGSGSNALEVNDVVFENCTFNGRVSGGLDNRVIGQSITGVQFINCVFQNGADLEFTYSGLYPYPNDNISICGTSFGSGSIIGQLSAVQWAGPDAITLDIDNTYADGLATTISEISSVYWAEADLDCLPGPPGIGGGNSTPSALKNATSAMLIAH